MTLTLISHALDFPRPRHSLVTLQFEYENLGRSARGAAWFSEASVPPWRIGEHQSGAATHNQDVMFPLTRLPAGSAALFYAFFLVVSYMLPLLLL